LMPIPSGVLQKKCPEKLPGHLCPSSVQEY